MKFTIERTVSPHDLGINNIATASAILRYMQEAAFMHMAACPPSMDQLRAENKAFIISKLSMSIYGTLRACDEIKISTWACDSKGYSFLRCARIEKDGLIVAEMETVSALVDITDRKLLRVSDSPQSYTTELPIELDMPARIRVPQNVNLSLAGEHTVTYTDCDLNHHINNTHYPDLICGFLPSMEKKRVEKMAISYMNEAPLSQTIKVYVSEEEDGTIWVRTVREDGTPNVECEIVLDDMI